MEQVREIPISKMQGFCVGNAQNEEAGTGVTVILFDGKRGANVGIDVSGGGPASRETTLCSPLTVEVPVNAIVLSGGSAFGLAASDGVVKYLEEHDIGIDTGFAKVPLVCQSCIYDLGYKSASVRPDAAMGYAACVDAEKNHPSMGSIGAGTGATAGKLCGMERATKTGLGFYAAELGELRMAAIVAVNALGDIFDPATGRKLAGLRLPDSNTFGDSCEELWKIGHRGNLFVDNTTISAIITNGKFSKAQMNKVASMARNAYARCINPIGTMVDGDTIYAASVGDVEADINVAGTLAAKVLEQAIVRAVKNA